MATVRVKLRGSGKDPVDVALSSPKATVGELKAKLSPKFKLAQLSTDRIRLTTEAKKVLEDDDKPISDYGVTKGATLLAKDLGFQISWRTVFLVEYIGPLIIHPLVWYFGQQYIYRQTFVTSRVQRLVFAMIVAHYIKREIETIFVHRFSHATMPWFNIVKNSAHYWILSGILLAIPLYGPWNSWAALDGSFRNTAEYLYPFVGLWIFAEVSNGATHWTLRSLRPPGTRTRAIPHGYGFDLISCPNYTFEAIAWLAVLFMTFSPFVAVFVAASVGQMAVWAQKKHRAYKKEFGKEYPKRAAMVPGLF